MLKDGQFALSQLPDKFHHALNNPEALRVSLPSLADYVSRKYRAYGFKDDKPIVYNPEFKPTEYPFDNDRFRWVECPESGMRHTGTAGDIVRLDYTGWYVDNFNNETCTGEVYQLPARDGVPQYIPAVSDPYGNDGAMFDFHSIFDNKEECARYADSMAESSAERDREHEAKQDAENRIQEIAEEIKTLYCDFRVTARTLRTLPSKINAKTLIAREWSSTRAGIEELKNEARKIEREGMSYS